MSDRTGRSVPIADAAVSTQGKALDQQRAALQCLSGKQGSHGALTGTGGPNLY